MIHCVHETAQGVKPFNLIIVHEGRCAIVTKKIGSFSSYFLLCFFVERARYHSRNLVTERSVIGQCDLIVERVSGIRESNPPPKLGKLMHYRCANAA